jgi:hypothetical protein
MAKGGKNEPRHVVAANDRMEKALSEMSTQLHGHALDTALRSAHGHAMGNVAGDAAPDNDAVLQKNQVVPQRIFADSGQASQGAPSASPSGADYQTSSADSVGDADSGGPTGL